MKEFISFENVTLVTSVITALLVAWVAFQQLRVSKYSLKKDLFDRRYTIFELSKDLLDSMITKERCDEEVFLKFIYAKNASKFLYSDRISSKMEEYYLISFEQRHLYPLAEDSYPTHISERVLSTIGFKDSNEIKSYRDFQLGVYTYSMNEYLNLEKLFKNELAIYK